MKPNEVKKGAKERRKSPRLKTRALVRAECGEEQFPLGNLSTTGAFIRTPEPLAVGKEVKLCLVGERLPEPIELTAVVRHSEQGVGMGVQFSQFRGKDQWRLELLLASLSVARILVVDDDEQIRRMLTLGLERENYDVLTAADGVEGLQKALNLQPDLIILDLIMPGLSGLEVCQRLRASPQLANVPIVILSATTNLADVSAAQRLGAVVFAPKPFKAQKFLNCVRMLLER